MGEARVELTGECEGCGAPNGLLGLYGDHFCPKCASNVDLRDAAEQHLNYLPHGRPWPLEGPLGGPRAHEHRRTARDFGPGDLRRLETGGREHLRRLE